MFQEIEAVDFLPQPLSPGKFTARAAVAAKSLFSLGNLLGSRKFGCRLLDV